MNLPAPLSEQSAPNVQISDRLASPPSNSSPSRPPNESLGIREEFGVPDRGPPLGDSAKSAEKHSVLLSSRQVKKSVVDIGQSLLSRFRHPASPSWVSLSGQSSSSPSVTSMTSPPLYHYATSQKDSGESPHTPPDPQTSIEQNCPSPLERSISSESLYCCDGDRNNDQEIPRASQFPNEVLFNQDVEKIAFERGRYSLPTPINCSLEEWDSSISLSTSQENENSDRLSKIHSDQQIEINSKRRVEDGEKMGLRDLVDVKMAGSQQKSNERQKYHSLQIRRIDDDEQNNIESNQFQLSQSDFGQCKSTLSYSDPLFFSIAESSKTLGIFSNPTTCSNGSELVHTSSQQNSLSDDRSPHEVRTTE